MASIITIGKKMSKVKAAVGFKINDGNFGSISIDFSLEDDTKPGETPEEGLNRVYDTVSAMLNEEKAKATAYVRSKRGKS